MNHPTASNFDLKKWQASIKNINIYAAAAIQEEKQPSLADKSSWKDFLDKRRHYRYGQKWPSPSAAEANTSVDNQRDQQCSSCELGCCFYSPSAHVVKQMEFCAQPSLCASEHPRCIPCQVSNHPCRVVVDHVDTTQVLPTRVSNWPKMKSKHIYIDRLEELMLVTVSGQL